MTRSLATNGHDPHAETGLNALTGDQHPSLEVGSIDLFDLQLFNQRLGRDPLPFPFMLTRPSELEFAEQVEARSAALPERIESGDLSRLARCLDALNHADITVAGHVQYIPASTPSIRLLAFRAGQVGYLMRQRADEDVVDVSAVSPYELGSGVAAAMALVGPGRHPTVVNGEFVPTGPAATEDDGFAVRHELHATPGVTVLAEQVSAYATVQTNWRPAKAWGIDKGKEFLAWVRVIDDGDYLGAPDRSHGTPLTTTGLGECIDRLIAIDLESLREFRGN